MTTTFVRGTTRTPEQVYRPHFVYSAWGEDGVCLYVGCTNNLARRMKEHASVSMSWVRRAVVMTSIEFPDRQQALDAESRQIDKLRPRYNVRDNPRFLTVGEAMDREQWSVDFNDLNFNGPAGRARYLERHPDATAQMRRWIVAQDRCDRRAQETAA